MPVRSRTSCPAAEVPGQENIFIDIVSRAVTEHPPLCGCSSLNPDAQEDRDRDPAGCECTLQPAAAGGRGSCASTIRESKNTPQAHLENFYHDFRADCAPGNYDGMIITGRRSELVEFEGVIYWPRIVEIIEVVPSARPPPCSCAGQCRRRSKALYGMEKQTTAKLSGVYRHHRLDGTSRCCYGFDDEFVAPLHTRRSTGISSRAHRSADLRRRVRRAGSIWAATRIAARCSSPVAEYDALTWTAVPAGSGAGLSCGTRSATTRTTTRTGPARHLAHYAVTLLFSNWLLPTSIS